MYVVSITELHYGAAVHTHNTEVRLGVKTEKLRNPTGQRNFKNASMGQVSLLKIFFFVFDISKHVRMKTHLFFLFNSYFNTFSDHLLS